MTNRDEERAAESQFLTIIIPSLYRLVPIRSVSGGEEGEGKRIMIM